jgi:hypothetical protein
MRNDLALQSARVLTEPLRGEASQNSFGSRAVAGLPLSCQLLFGGR